jgi:transforming growth factor-beta-induced protein
MMNRTASLMALAMTFVGAACSDDDDDIDVERQTVVDVAREAGTFETLVGALEATGLDQALAGEGPFTVFAPTDAAFARLPAGVLASLDDGVLSDILSYHVTAGRVPAATVVTLEEATTLEGGAVSIRVVDGTVILDGTVQVVQTDIAADNGVIHVIDAVLLPPGLPFPGTLVDAVLAYPIFDTLAGAVVRADLVEALQGDNAGAGFTLFAPGDPAFTDLGIDLSTLSDEQLADVLLYHVVGATVPSSEVVGMTEATTLQGSTIGIEVDDGSVVLNEQSTVTWTDVEADNGVLHVIDAVLLPPE